MWLDAEQRCRDLNAHLVSIITPEEQHFVNCECIMCVCVHRDGDKRGNEKIRIQHFCLTQQTHRTTSGSGWTTRRYRTTSAGQTEPRWWVRASQTTSNRSCIGTSCIQYNYTKMQNDHKKMQIENKEMQRDIKLPQRYSKQLQQDVIWL